MNSVDNIIQKIERIIKANREDGYESKIAISVDWIKAFVGLAHLEDPEDW